MAIRISGLNSGLDTESLVSELVSAYRTKTEKYTKAQTKLTWKQDVWSSLSAKTLSFRTSLDSLRFSSAYKLKTTSVSNSTKATITASNSAVNGTQSLNITQLAKSGYLTGGKLSATDGSSATTSTKLSDLNTSYGTDSSAGTASFSGSGKISVNGTDITLTDDMSISDVVSKLNSAGVTASFDATNQRIFVSAKESGQDSDFTLSALDDGGKSALQALGLYTSSETSTDLYKQYTGYINDGETSADAAQRVLDEYKQYGETVNQATSASSYLTQASAYITAKQNSGYNTVNDKLSGMNDAEKATANSLLEDSTQLVDANGETYKKTTDDDGKTCYESSDGTKYYLTEKSETLNGVTTSEKILTTAAAPTEDELAAGKSVQTASEYLGVEASDISQYNSAKATIDSFEATAASIADSTGGTADADSIYNKYLSDVVSAVGNIDFADEDSIKAAQDAIQAATDGINNDSTRIEAQTALDDNSLIASYIKDYAAGDTTAVDRLTTQLQFAADAQTATDYSTGAVRVNGQDAKIYLNGAEFTSSSNTFTINGLTINALATTTTEEKIKNGTADEDALSITTATDTQGIYDQIKDFLSTYNTLINTMTSYYNADSSTSDYEPLTDDEKDEMTDSQIEKWEEKGKSGVLRRDTTLSALMSTMTNAMAKSYTINGKNYSLSSFGIKTLGILNAETNEQNAYHIDGDEDDDSTSANTDKLMAAIISDPDSVTQFFQKLSSELYDSLGKKMSSTTLRSYGTFYNDKEMAKEYSDYTTTISKWETKLSDMEDSYYKKFAAMESALAKLQSNSSSLSGLLG